MPGSASSPVIRVDRCHTADVRISDGASGTVSDRQNGANASTTESTTTRCSSRSFADAASASPASRSCSGSRWRGMEPASGLRRPPSARPGQQHLGGGADQRAPACAGRGQVDRVGVARGVVGGQVGEQRDYVDLAGRVQPQRTGEHDLLQLPASQPGDRGGHGALVVLRRGHRDGVDDVDDAGRPARPGRAFSGPDQRTDRGSTTCGAGPRPVEGRAPTASGRVGVDQQLGHLCGQLVGVGLGDDGPHAGGEQTPLRGGEQEGAGAVVRDQPRVTPSSCPPTGRGKPRPAGRF